MHEKPNISDEHLRICLHDQYDIAAAMLEFLPLGLDTLSAVYRVVSEQGTAYLLKARSGAFYAPSCQVPRYLRDQGIASVAAPLPTKSGMLWTRMGDWTLTLSPFIVGNTGWTPAMTAEQWRATGSTLRQMHQMPLPPGGFAGLRQETFDVTGYRHWVQVFDTHFAGSDGKSQLQDALRSYWMAHQATIHLAMTSLATLAGVLQERSGPHVICHADLHPGNLIRDQAENVFVIDWEDVMAAPKERDFLFVEASPVEAAARPDNSPFFQGYGQAAIDWIAFAYYLWERVVQDLIVSAQIVVHRDDVGEAAKADELRVFRDTLAKGGMVDYARAASASLPPDLGLHIED